MLLPASVAAPCALLLTRFFSALMSLPAFFDVLLMSRATLLRPPGSFDCEPLIPVVFLRTVLVSLPASFSAPCVLLASRLISAFVSRPAFLDVLLTSCATLLRPPGLWSSDCARAVATPHSESAAASAAMRTECFIGQSSQGERRTTNAKCGRI